MPLNKSLPLRSGRSDRTCSPSLDGRRGPAGPHPPRPGGCPAHRPQPDRRLHAPPSVESAPPLSTRLRGHPLAGRGRDGLTCLGEDGCETQTHTTLFSRWHCWLP
jgi:hypothetical protein